MQHAIAWEGHPIAYQSLHQAPIIYYSLGFLHALRRDWGDTEESAPFALVDFQRADFLRPRWGEEEAAEEFAKKLKQEAIETPKALRCEIE
ncbi:hypothetical protein I317_06371 [Kwoniella heveanensis CBS 569]|uniref:Uncharacterized protein n=1 Tax=Kwoniella heveanensis BCC8398 TaxID=1296120 RepID=A0A1B9GLA3_9TREE|nr:hypothetical protein I316_06560 [Kwoniella heveanensis BCC8398]OCF39819.1 hypothetical protein I317_06371 [Kwoniella heveanensis CBS 569]